MTDQNNDVSNFEAIICVQQQIKSSGSAETQTK